MSSLTTFSDDATTTAMLDKFKEEGPSFKSMAGALAIALQEEFESDADLLNGIGAVENGLKDGGIDLERAVKVLAIMREGLEGRLPTVGFLVMAANTICRQLKERKDNTEGGEVDHD